MKRSGRRRRVSPDDLAVWEHVVRSVSPMHRDRPAATALPPPAEPAGPPRVPADPPHLPARPARVLKPTGRPSPAPDFAWPPADARPAPVGRPEPGLDRRTAERLRRGERAPDARIDLHGMTAERAHRRLDAFIAESARAGHRMVLVITGKGGRRRGAEEAAFMAPEQGVLREAVPKWLRSGPPAPHVLGIYEAHQRHGGAGALYVYLRRRR